MRRLIRLPTLLLCLMLAASAGAAELSPWLGNDGQAPFQLDPTTMVAVTFAADPLHTGSIAKAPCNTETCLMPPKAATNQSRKP